MNNLERFKSQVTQAMKDGGITLGVNEKNFLKTCNYKKGFQVGGFSKELLLDINVIEKFNNDEWLKLYYDVLALIPNFYESGMNLGLWVDKGMLYIEVSKRILSKKEALQVASTKNQIAIWDWKNEQSLYI